MKTKFCHLHFRGRSTLHKIGKFYLSDHTRHPQFGQNAILARSKAKIRNWRIINCFLYTCAKPFSRTKNEGKLFLVPKLSGPLLERLPFNFVDHINFANHLYLTKNLQFGGSSWLVLVDAGRDMYFGKLHLLFTWKFLWGTDLELNTRAFYSTVCSHTIHSSWKNKRMSRMWSHFALSRL